MKLQFRKSVGDDKEVIRSFLQTTKLPAESLDKDTTTFYMAEESNRIAGIAGFEFYGSDALLRSVAVQPGIQRRGLGSQIVDFMLDEARKRKVQNVALLTETAKDFFLKKGFEVVDRSTIDNESMKKSSEFAYACPEMAVCMRIRLK
ncbi:MAG TPA: arsenic resistance N-acetyltransferase ArsN2 [Candidatus Acidoferrales bacterium]|nr:arsenic resistance N-acetyltransferase ArsN2 [Candidatus Acidoferrales bacterium]